MGRILIFLILLPGFSSYPMPSFGAENAPPSAESKKDEEAGPAKDGEKGKDEGGKSKKPSDVTGGRFAGDPVYVHLPPLILPILGNTGPEQLVTMQITVQVKDFDAGDHIHSNMPKVMDAIMRALYGGLTDGNLRNGRLVDVNKVKAKATAALQSVEGADNIKDVLIVNMSQRTL